MNEIIVGADKSPFLDVEFSKNVLFIDDGPLIDQLKIPARRKVVEFDVSKLCLNPLKGTRDFIAVLDAVFPEGANTLTRKNSNFVLLEALLDKPTYPYGLLKPDKKDPATQDAYQKIQTLLISPVLGKVLCNPTNFSLNGLVLARLDRAKLGDFDAFVLGSLLISMFEGQVIVPDFGFYGREHHIALIRQGRLIAGVTTSRKFQ